MDRLFANDKLKKVSLQGVGTVTLAEEALPRGASWGPDGTIVYTPRGFFGLMQVSAAGGTPKPFSRLDDDRGEQTHRWPQIVGNGSAVIFSIWSSGSYDDSEIVLQRLDKLDGEERRYLARAAYARYTTSGHLIYARSRTLFALPLDLDEPEVTGAGVPVQTEVEANSLGPGQAQFDVSETGTLVYLASAPRERRLMRVRLEGAREPLSAPPLAYHSVRFAPDGRQLALTVEGGGEVYIYDMGPERLSLFDSRFEDGEGKRWPPGEHLAWSPDGRRLAIPSRSTGGPNVFSLSADGTGLLYQLTDRPSWQIPADRTRDSNRVLFMEQDMSTVEFDIIEVALGGNGASELVVGGPGNQTQPPSRRTVAGSLTPPTSRVGAKSTYDPIAPAAEENRSLSTAACRQPGRRTGRKSTTGMAIA